MPDRRARRLLALLLGLACAAICAPAGASPVAGTLRPDSIAVRAPGDAAPDPELRLTDVECPGAGNCWAIGTYHTATGTRRGVIAHLVNGAWRTAAAPEPVFADTDPRVTLNVLTCASVHFCVAFGTYIDATDQPQKQGLLETYQRETPDGPLAWSGARLVATPGGATVARIAAASCSPDRTCAAVGSYTQLGVRHGLLETYAPSGWVAGDAPLPLNARARAGSSLAAVDCPATDTCFAMGSFVTTAAEHTGLLERYDSSGQWTPGRAKDASSGHSDPQTHLTAVSCTSASFCAIGGRFTGGTGHRQVGFLEQWANSAYSDGISAPVPLGSATDPEMSLTAMSCVGTRNCAATSTRADAHGHLVGALLTLASGKWHAVAAPLVRAAANPHVHLVDLACGKVAVGSYTDADKRVSPILERLGGKESWTARQGPRPAHAGTGDAWLVAVACDPDGHAFAVGRYVDNGGRHRGLITRNAQA